MSDKYIQWLDEQIAKNLTERIELISPKAENTWTFHTDRKVRALEMVAETLLEVKAKYQEKVSRESAPKDADDVLDDMIDLMNLDGQWGD